MTKRIPNVLVFLLTLLISSNGLLGTAALASPTSPLDVTDTDSPDPVLSGTELMYTWQITNTGGAKVTEVVASTHVDLAGIGVPPQLVITSTVGTCTQLSSTVTCTAGTLQGGQSWFVTIRGLVNAAAGTTLNNTVTVTGTKSAQTFTTSASASTLVIGPGPGGPKPDLSVQKTGPANVAVSASFTYSLNVNNTGSANATNVRVVDTLPSGVAFTSAGTTSLFTCTYDLPSNTVTCDGGAINAGANATITLDVVAPATTGQIANNAVVDPLNTIDEGNELNNTSATIYTTVTPPPPPPPFTITKVQTSPTHLGQPGVVVPGDIVTYTITATNISGYRADYDVLTDATQGLEASSLTATATATGNTTTTPVCTIAAPNANCSWTRWPSGATATMIVTGKVVASAGTTIIDTATIQGNVRNTGYSATTKLPSVVKPGIDLTITKSDSPDPVCARSWPPVDPAILCSGGLTYTFVIGNSGILDATGVVVRDPLPAGSILDSYGSTGGFTCASDAASVVTCTGGTIPHESTRLITLVIVAPATTGTITNTVTVDPNNNIFESDETNNTASQSTVVSTGIDLVVAKFDSPVPAPTPLQPGSPNGFDPIATSGTETYIIIVDNLGPANATGIRVRDTLPAGTTFLSAEGTNGFTCSYSGGFVDCMGGHILGSEAEFYAGGPATPAPAPIPAGEDHAIITIKIFAMPNVGLMHNEVRVDPLSEIPEINEANNLAVQDTTVGTGDSGMGAFNQLTITKAQTAPTPIGTPVARNAVVTYDLTVENKGTDPAANVTVRDVLPSGARYISADDTVPGVYAFNCGAVGAIITCNGGTMSGTVTAIGLLPTVRHITVRMFAPDVPGTYVNQAIVDPDNLIPEGNEFDNVSNVTLVVVNAGIGPFNELSIVKTAVPSLLTQNGSPIEYTLTVTNTGSDPAFNVVVKDFLPAGTTFLSAWDDTPPGGVLPQVGDFLCIYAAGVVTCSGGTLDGTSTPPNGPLGLDYPTTRLIKIQVTAPNIASLDAVNQAFVDPDNVIAEGDETNNTSSVLNQVRSYIDLQAKKHGPPSASQSSTFEYELEAINIAPTGPPVTPGATAYNVTLHDALPVGLIVLGAVVQDAENNDWNCQVQENPVNVVDCVGTLASGETNEVKIKIKVFVTAADDLTLTNEVCIDYLNTIVESNENNNCSTLLTTVGAPDLAVTKTALVNPVSPGQNEIYSINVINIGNVDATAASIDDTLPTGVTYVSAIGTNGFTCTPPAAGHVMCSYTGGGSVALAKNGGSTTITLTVKVDNGTTNPITNKVDVSSTPSDPNASNNHAEVTTSVSGAGIDLQLLSVQDVPDPVSQGGVLTYTIMVLNSGTAPAGVSPDPAVVIRSTIGDGLNSINAIASEGFTCAPTGDSPITVDCTSPATGFAAGHTVTVTITALVDAGAPSSVTNEVKVDPANAITESNETNNDFTAVTSIVASTCPASPPGDPCIDLIAGPILATPDPVSGTGGTLNYTITVGNAGNVSTATGTNASCAFWGGCAVIEVDLPTEVTFNTGSASASAGFTCSEVFLPALICAGDLNAGQGVVISFTGNVTAAAGTVFTTTLTAFDLSDISDFNSANNSRTEDTTAN